MSVINNPIDIHLLTNCTHYSDKYLLFISNCIAAGVNHIQLRQKNWQFKELLAFGKDLKILLDKYQVPLIINDNLKLALELDAAGVHLGQTDISINQARKHLGKHKIIGLSIENIEELKIANRLTSINYVAASAVFPSKTKNNLKTIWGIDGLQRFCNISKHPVIAIGGISHTNVNKVVATGINGIAIISAIHEAPDPKFYIEQLIKLTSGE